jgi:hypothetical protein
MAELAPKGVRLVGEPADGGFRIVVTMVLSGDVWALRCEPRHHIAGTRPRRPGSGARRYELRINSSERRC